MENNLYDNFKKYNVPGKKNPVWYNLKLGQEVNSEIKAVLDKLEEAIDPSKRIEAIDFMKLPKIGERGEKVTAGSELPKMILNLTGKPSSKNESIELTGTLSSSETTITETDTGAATPVRPSKGPEELLNDAFNLLRDRPEDPEAQAEAEFEALGAILGDLLKDSVEKLTSIDKGILELLSYFKSEEKEEDAAEIEMRRAKERQDAERFREQKELNVEELTQRAEALESQNKEKAKTKDKTKDKDGFFKLLQHNLATEMPYLFKDPYKKEEEKEEDEDEKDSGVVPILAAGGAALAAGGAALATGTGLSLGYLSDVTGVSSTLSQTFLGTSEEEADKAAAQRAEATTSFVDELLGIERVSKKDGSLDWKKTWGFENPFEVAEDYLFRGEGPLAPTGSKYKERTTEMLRPTPVPKADLADPTKNLAKISDDVSKASKKQMQSATVINNNTVNNITNQNATSLTSINSRGRGALELAT